LVYVIITMRIVLSSTELCGRSCLENTLHHFGKVPVVAQNLVENVGSTF